MIILYISSSSSGTAIILVLLNETTQHKQSTPQRDKTQNEYLAAR